MGRSRKENADAIDFAAELARKPVFASPEVNRAAVVHPHSLLAGLVEAGIRTWTGAAQLLGADVDTVQKWVRGQVPIRDEAERVLAALRAARIMEL